MRFLPKSILNKIRDMVHTPAEGIDRGTRTSPVRWLILSPRSRSRPSRSAVAAVAPISALLPELLAQIFRSLTLVVPSLYGWVVVTHVCQRWRQVALGDSLLWATTNMGFALSAKWLSEMLVRARNAPLDVYFAGPARGILFVLTPHVFHIRRLRLRGLSLSVFRGVLEICALEAPVLEHLELGVSAVYLAAFHRFGETTLFRGRAPKLRTRTLSLSEISIPWSLIPRGQLTQLEVTHLRGMSSHSTPVSNDSNQLLDLLVNSPELEALVLEFCLPTMHFEAPDGQAVHLPRLSRLCLAGSTSHVANLFKVLRLPSSTTLHLRCFSVNLLTHNVNIILPHVSAHFHSPAPVEFRILRLTINGLDNPIYVNASSHPNPKPTIPDLHSLGDTNSDAELTMSFHGLSWCSRSTQGDVLEAVFRILPISNLEFLSIWVPYFVSSVNWYELSQHCENVTTIQANGHGTDGFLRSLAPLEPTKTTSGSKGNKGRCVNRATGVQGTINIASTHTPITPFPKLTSLLLKNLNFGFAMNQYGVLYDAFAYVLQRRRANNTSLNVLGLDHCVITPGRAKGLETYVQELRWDGGEGTPSKE